jgi:hypothetical protein
MRSTKCGNLMHDFSQFPVKGVTKKRTKTPTTFFVIYGDHKQPKIFL